MSLNKNIMEAFWSIHGGRGTRQKVDGTLRANT